jgi:hypothetical protein
MRWLCGGYGVAMGVAIRWLYGGYVVVMGWLCVATMYLWG